MVTFRGKLTQTDVCCLLSSGAVALNQPPVSTSHPYYDQIINLDVIKIVSFCLIVLPISLFWTSSKHWKTRTGFTLGGEKTCKVAKTLCIKVHKSVTLKSESFLTRHFLWILYKPDQVWSNRLNMDWKTRASERDRERDRGALWNAAANVLIFCKCHAFITLFCSFCFQVHSLPWCGSAGSYSFFGSPQKTHYSDLESWGQWCSSKWILFYIFWDGCMHVVNLIIFSS